MSNTDLIGQYSGIGAVPVGVVMPWVSGYFTAGTNTGHTPILASADTVAAANAYLNPLGYYVCDGSAPNVTGSPIWNAAGRYLPNLTDSRFLMGSTAIGSAANGGSNVMGDHRHANTNLTVVADTTHTHSWGGHWSNDGATSYTSDNGDGSGNTRSDANAGIDYWGSGSYASRATASDSGTLAHSHSVRTNSFAGDRPVGMGNSGADSDWYMIGDVGIANQGALYANSDNGSLAHAHTYYLPSHRHWIKSRPTSTSSHGHNLSGFIGSGSVDPVAGTIENRPKYMNCLMIIRVK